MDDATNVKTQHVQSVFATRHLHPFLDQRMIDPTYTKVLMKGEGLNVWDSDGKRYLDGISGLFCTALGYGRQELVDAAARQLSDLSYCSPFFNTTHPKLAELSERLFSLLPERFGRVVYTNSGSEANETLIRTVRRYWDVVGKPEKKILIARHNGYHGSTMGSASLGGMKYMHEMGDLPIPGIHHIGEPFWFGYEGERDEAAFGLSVAQELEQKILELGPDKVAAFVAEPIQGSAGVIIPPATYWPEIQRICRKYDVLLCLDEVIGGFGRTGEWFSHQLFGIEPDTISIAKGLTSGYAPMGGLVLSRRVADAIVEGGLFAHGLTYQGHPLPAAIACANLALLNEGGIVERVKSDLGPYLQSALQHAFADHPLVWEIHGAGMLASLQLAPVKGQKKRFSDELVVGSYCMYLAQEDGLLFRASYSRLIIAPALVATHAEIDELVEKAKRAIDRIADLMKT
jgi:putrescine aminotransferase